MSVNVPLLRKAVEWVESEVNRPKAEREWDQFAWCGTRMCVAGYVAVVEGWMPANDHTLLVERNGQRQRVPELAAQLLGLTYMEANRLFICTIDDTPELEARNIRRVAEDIAGERL